MSRPNLSRRSLLSAILAVLFAWLLPRPRRATAAPRRLALPAAWRSSKYDCAVTYIYDRSSRLIGEEERLVYRAEPRPCPPLRRGQVTSYSYDTAAPDSIRRY